MLFLNLLLVVCIGRLINGPVEVTTEIPARVQAGEEFPVVVSIRKGDLRGFSRFVHELPAGLSASREETAYADFSTGDHRVRFIWLKLPRDDQIMISYRVHVHERLKGSFSLSGSFSYVDNNERKSVQTMKENIQIIPSPDIPEDMLVDIAEFERAVASKTEIVDESRPVCVRGTPFLDLETRDIMVNLLVDAGKIRRYMKIEENIPEGFKAVEVESAGSIFSFKNGIAKFIWMDVPGNGSFMITYKLVPENGKTAEDLEISGIMSYITDGTTRFVQIMEKDTDLRYMQSEAKAGLLAETRRTAEESHEPEQPAKKSVRAEDIREKPFREELPKRFGPVRIDPDYLFRPMQGTYYRVQIAAGHTPVNVRRYFSRFNVPARQVRVEQHQGWLKYSIGNFFTYQDAKDRRVHIWETSTIDDAFVSAYHNQKRITVQEALMITGQKWYK